MSRTLVLRVEASQGCLVARGERVRRGQPVGAPLEGPGQVLSPGEGTVTAVGFDPAAHAYVVEIELDEGGLDAEGRCYIGASSPQIG
ncbi:MAG: hypothetical protein ACM3XS_07300 [Bacteroidota bacterium]